MHGVGVGGRMYRDGSDAEFLARPQNAQGDLAAIGYQDLVEHVVLVARSEKGRMANGEKQVEGGLSGRRLSAPLFAVRHFLFAPYSIITTGSPNSTGGPSSTRISVTG